MHETPTLNKQNLSSLLKETAEALEQRWFFAYHPSRSVVRHQLDKSAPPLHPLPGALISQPFIAVSDTQVFVDGRDGNGLILSSAAL
ncbi:hypothetical protein FDECE_15074 [Fusarium decemcellulare]|nr:hypothetical protein FDECE_15074 [Fusarium decemcellulare]